MVQNQITMSLCLHYCYLTVGFCILTVFCEAVRSAILATAWLLVNKQGQAAKQEADSKTAKYQELKRHTFFPSCHRDSGIMEPASHWTGARNQETRHCHHTGQQINHLPVLQAVYVAFQKGNAVSFLGTLRPARLVRHYSHLHLLILSPRLCASWRKE